MAAYEASGGREANTLRGRAEWPIVVITSRGAKSGKLRKNPVMRVEHEGVYAAVASKGGEPEHPTWYHNFLAHPTVLLQDGAEAHESPAPSALPLVLDLDGTLLRTDLLDETFMAVLRRDPLSLPPRNVRR